MTIKKTANGVAYLTDSEVAIIAYTQTELGSAFKKLRELNPMFNLAEEDDKEYVGKLTDSERLVKFAGQICYLALDEKRTKNVDAERYFTHIKESQHGSVLEHANVSVLFLGIDRAVTHELVRHRAGFAYSQVSQRYVGPDKLRFVLPSEIADHPELVTKFEREIDGHWNNYVSWIDEYVKIFPSLEGETKTDKKKRVQSAARRCLPNCTEAPIVVTGNLRAWRHVFEKRLNKSADIAIRKAIFKAFIGIREITGTLMNDFKVFPLPDGSLSASTELSKV